MMCTLKPTGIREGRVGAGGALGISDEEAELGPHGQVMPQLLRGDTRHSNAFGAQHGMQTPSFLWTLQQKPTELLTVLLFFYLDPGARKRPLNSD